MATHSRYEKMLDEMVDKFLSMKLPADLSPDGGLVFEKTFQGYGETIVRDPSGPHWPIGTNLFHAEQAREMFRQCVPPFCFGLDNCTVNMRLSCNHAKNCGK